MRSRATGRTAPRSNGPESLAARRTSLASGRTPLSRVRAGARARMWWPSRRPISASGSNTRRPNLAAAPRTLWRSRGKRCTGAKANSSRCSIWCVPRSRFRRTRLLEHRLRRLGNPVLINRGPQARARRRGVVHRKRSDGEDLRGMFTLFEVVGASVNAEPRRASPQGCIRTGAPAVVRDTLLAGSRALTTCSATILVHKQTSSCCRAIGELQVCRPPTRGPCFAADAVLRHTDPGDAAQLALRRTQVAVREHLCLSRRLLPIVTSRACASPGSACSRRSARYCFALDAEATPLQVRRIVVDAGVAGRWSRAARSDMLGI